MERSFGNSQRCDPRRRNPSRLSLGARYTPAADVDSCSLAKAPDRPRVAPGAAMPPGEGCNKQDDAVLFVIGVAVEN